MREIKFRFWDKVEGTMIMPPESAVLLPHMQCGTLDKRYVPMQYTGYKDKNGKEIYEGDIVKYPYPGGTLILKDYIKDTYHLLVDLIFNNIQVEVVGNIYENSEKEASK